MDDFMDWLDQQSDEFKGVFNTWCLSGLLGHETIRDTDGDAIALQKAFELAKHNYERFW